MNGHAGACSIEGCNELKAGLDIAVKNAGKGQAEPCYICGACREGTGRGLLHLWSMP
jgi:hypothetical protein